MSRKLIVEPDVGARLASFEYQAKRSISTIFRQQLLDDELSLERCNARAPEQIAHAARPVSGRTDKKIVDAIVVVVEPSVDAIPQLYFRSRAIGAQRCYRMDFLGAIALAQIYPDETIRVERRIDPFGYRSSKVCQAIAVDISQGRQPPAEPPRFMPRSG